MNEPSIPIEPNSRGVVAVIRRGEKFLVIRRSQHVRAPGMHCFPGGGIEQEESEEAAIRRELQEELGLAALGVRKVWESTTPWQVRLTWWLTTIEAAAEPVPHPLEVESCHWLTAVEIRQLPALLPSNVEFLNAWESGAFELG